MTKQKKALSLALSAVLLGTVLTTGCSTFGGQESQVEETDRNILVETAYPEVGDIALAAEYIGKLEPAESVMVTPKTSGEVLKTYAKVGDIVKKGDLLFELDASDLMPAVNLAKANLELTKLSAASSETQLDQAVLQARSSVIQAKSAYDNARFTYNDTYGSDYDGDKSDYNYRKLKAARDAAASSYDLAQQLLELTEGESLEENKALIAQQLVLAEANYQVQTQQLGFTKVYAPIDGVVEAKNADEHQMSGGTSVAYYTISNKGSMLVNFAVPSSVVLGLSIDDPVAVTINGEERKGAIIEVSTAADQQTGLFAVKARIDEDGSDLLTGVTVKIAVDTDRAEAAILLPVSCVYYEDNKPFVYVDESGTAVRVDVTTGINDDNRIEILSGVSKNDRVITTWHPNLMDGAKIMVADSNSAESSAANSEGDEA